MVRRFLAAGLCICVLAARPAHAEELRPQLDDLVNHFGQVLFGNEYQIADTPNVVSKWRASPVGIAVQGRKTPELVEIAARHVRALTGVTGIRFKTIQPGEPGPNIDLIFMKRAEMRGLAKQLPPREAAVVRKVTGDPTMTCFFLVWHKPAETIVKAMVVANVERDPVMIDA